MPRGVARCAAEQELHVRALRPGGGAARREPEEEDRVMASREALQKLIQFGNAEQFATHAEDWSACSSAAILNAAVEQLGKLTQQRAYKDNAGTTVQDWNARRTELQESLKLARRRQLSEAREVLIRAAKALNLSVEDVAAEKGLSRRYLQSLWECLEGTLHGHGPIQKLRALWQALPEPMADGGTKPSIEALVPLVDYVSAARQIIQFDIPHVRSKGIHNGAQAFVMWRNRQKAAHRMKVDLDRLAALSADDRQWLGLSSAQAPASTLLSEDEKESVIFFGRLFPDRFYVAERGREFLDPDANREKAERGRLLSAGFHSMMGYFRDDQPLCALMLEQEENATLDRLWDELDFMTRAPMRQHQGLVWFERTDSKFMRDEAFDFARAEDKDVTSEPKIRRLADVYLEKALSLGADALAVEAIQEHFDHINRSIRQVESWEQEARYHHLRDLERLAEKAYRRPLEGEEAESLRAFYRRLIVEDGLSHEQAVRDTLVSVLVSPHFWFRMDMPAGLPEVHPLPSLALANRLSFFLWSSMPMQILFDGVARFAD